jgi:RecG-like helicase
MYEKVGRGVATHAARLVPIYSLTKGITEKQIRFLISQIISLAKDIKSAIATTQGNRIYSFSTS